MSREAQGKLNVLIFLTVELMMRGGVKYVINFIFLIKEKVNKSRAKDNSTQFVENHTNNLKVVGLTPTRGKLPFPPLSFPFLFITHMKFIASLTLIYS